MSFNFFDGIMFPLTVFGKISKWSSYDKDINKFLQNFDKEFSDMKINTHKQFLDMQKSMFSSIDKSKVINDDDIGDIAYKIMQSKYKIVTTNSSEFYDTTMTKLNKLLVSNLDLSGQIRFIQSSIKHQPYLGIRTYWTNKPYRLDPHIYPFCDDKEFIKAYTKYRDFRRKSSWVNKPLTTDELAKDIIKDKRGYTDIVEQLKTEKAFKKSSPDNIEAKEFIDDFLSFLQESKENLNYIKSRYHINLEIMNKYKKECEKIKDKELPTKYEPKYVVDNYRSLVNLHCATINAMVNWYYAYYKEFLIIASKYKDLINTMYEDIKKELKSQ